LSWELGPRRRSQLGEGGGGEDDIEGVDSHKASEEPDMDAGHQGQAEDRKGRYVQGNTTSRKESGNTNVE